jgi:hypothetical protein
MYGAPNGRGGDRSISLTWQMEFARAVTKDMDHLVHSRPLCVTGGCPQITTTGVDRDLSGRDGATGPNEDVPREELIEQRAIRFPLSGSSASIDDPAEELAASMGQPAIGLAEGWASVARAGSRLSDCSCAGLMRRASSSPPTA